MADRLSVRHLGSPYHDDFTILLKLAFDRAMALESSVSEATLKINGMSGKCYRMFINNLVRIVSKPRYLEVGSWAGSTACSAIDGNIVTALCIDNWSQFGGPKEEFFANIDRLKTDRISFSFIESDFRTVPVVDIGSFNVYLFDGPHAYQDQYDGLALYDRALDDDVFFIVDDWNWPSVRAGTKAAIRDAGFAIDYAIEIRTTQDDSHTEISIGQDSEWHNGYFLSKLSRATRRYDAS